MTNKNLVNSIDGIAAIIRKQDEDRAKARLFYRGLKLIGKKALIVSGVIIGWFFSVSLIAIFVLRYMYGR